MNIKKLHSFHRFYRSTRLMGADAILRNYLDLSEDFPVPLSLSHGVDMNHTNVVFDVNQIEPIHWAYNKYISERCSNIKQAVEIPHPWLLIKNQSKPKAKFPILIIGPSPGKINDSNLIAALKLNNIRSGHILLKKLRDTEKSEKFWSENSYVPVTAGWRDAGFYLRLSNILRQYETIYSVTLSGALFFAASLGIRCRLIQGYSDYYYEVPGFEKIINFRANVGVMAVNLLINEKDEDFSNFSREILGSSFLKNKEELLSIYLKSLEKINSPVYCNQSLTTLEKVLAPYVAKYFNRPGFCRIGFQGFRKNKNNSCYVIRANEIDLWLNGRNESNFIYQEIPYVENITVPGYGVESESHVSLFQSK